MGKLEKGALDDGPVQTLVVDSVGQLSSDLT